MLGALRMPEGVPLVGDTHNVEFDNLRRAFEEGYAFVYAQYQLLTANVEKWGEHEALELLVELTLSWAIA